MSPSQPYQTDLKPGSLYKLVRLHSADNNNPSQFHLFRRIQTSETAFGFALAGGGYVENAILLYVDSEFPEHVGDGLDENRAGMHRVVYKDVIGLLSARWHLEEIVDF